MPPSDMSGKNPTAAASETADTTMDSKNEISLEEPTTQDHAPKEKEPSSVFQRLTNKTQKFVDYYLNNYVLLALSAATGMSSNAFCVKLLSSRFSPFQLLSIHSAIALVVLCVMCRRKGVSLSEARPLVGLVLLRGLLGGSAFLSSSVSAFLMPLSETVFIANSYLVVTSFLSYMFGMEKLGVLSWIGAIGVIVGNALVARPPFIFGGDEDWGTQRFIGIACACIANLSMASVRIVLRHLNKRVNSLILTAFVHAWILMVCLPFAISGYPKPCRIPINWQDIIPFVWISFSGVPVQYCLSRASQLGPPSKTSALLMTNMLMSTAIGVLILSEDTSVVFAIGATTIVISISLVLVQNSINRGGGQSVDAKPDGEEIEVVVRQER